MKEIKKVEIAVNIPNGEKSVIEYKAGQKIFYVCDRNACKKCNPECKHTSDITHAKNFEAIGNAIFEKDE